MKIDEHIKLKAENAELYARENPAEKNDDNYHRGGRREGTCDHSMSKTAETGRYKLT